MRQAALSAGRTLRSTLRTTITGTSPWSQSSSFGVASLSLSRAKNEDISRLSSRLSQRLASAGVGNNFVVTHSGGARSLTSRTKKRRAGKLEVKKTSSSRAKLKPTKDRSTKSSKVYPQWTAVGAALNSLEESIDRTNLLLHSLASGEAWARRTRSPRPRLSWDANTALDSASGGRTLGPTHTTRALTALLQELSQKQAIAADLLSRLDQSTNDALPNTHSFEKTFESVLSSKPTNQANDLQTHSKSDFESGWGSDTLTPSSTGTFTLPSEPFSSDGIVKDGAPSAANASAEKLQGVVEPDSVSLDSVTRDPGYIVPIPTLQHGLDRVLFNPGVHWLQDPHSRVYNFPPELQAMPAFTSFAYEKVNSFVTSSKDEELANLARRQGKKFIGSTSSVSMILAHIYFMISNWRDVDTSVLSASFVHMSKDFSAGQKMPYTFFMRRNNGVIAFDSGSQSDDPFDQNILSYIGVMLEKLLTLSKEDFETLLRNNPVGLDGKTVLPEREAYRYSMSNSMVLRSQLDCMDSRLPGTGVFDLKTRAAISVRQDVWNVEIGSGYQIRSATGPFESFEREYYDLCRSALLKYSFQARIGAMDGVFVAYHNTSRMFGFQYIPLREMDERLFGGHEGGEHVFRACLGLLEVVAEHVASCFPGQDVKAMIYTSESMEPELSVWVEPAIWNEATPAPVYEIRLNVFHTISGEHVPPGGEVTFEKPDWKINYSLIKITPSTETRANRDKALARQQAIRTSCLPEGTTIEELSNRMKGGVLEGYAPRNLGDADAIAEPDGDGVSSNTLDAWNKRFRTQATPFVRSLRELSKKGLEDLNRWTKDESPKVVYKPRV
ncbi:hypothetical protein FRC07_013281 [Ceratobasidium sp. 392]|nr:hypothetical protein FRC07_013281 [Ceratobasidium sp. 392]